MKFRNFKPEDLEFIEEFNIFGVNYKILIYLVGKGDMITKLLVKNNNEILISEEDSFVRRVWSLEKNFIIADTLQRFKDMLDTHILVKKYNKIFLTELNKYDVEVEVLSTDLCAYTVTKVKYNDIEKIFEDNLLKSSIDNKTLDRMVLSYIKDIEEWTKVPIDFLSTRMYNILNELKHKSGVKNGV